MYVLGIDVGTSGAKALLLDERGRTAAQGYAGYTVHRGAEGWVEQDAEDWWRAVADCVRECCVAAGTRDVGGICLSTQGASSLLMGRDGNPMGPAITWMDLRAAPQRQSLESAKGSEWFYHKTGWPLNPSLDACKALWLAQNRPEDLEKAWLFVSTLEYINLRLTGTAVIDPTNAAMRQLMNLRTMDWDDEILEQVGLPRDKLPAIRPSGECIGTLSGAAAEALGLRAGIPVYNGAHDQYCCALGSGSVRRGDTYLGTGTAWALMHNADKPLFTPSRLSPGPHILPGMWGALSSIPAGGISLSWAKDVTGQNGYEAIDKKALERMGKNRGLLFFPYFTGIGCPEWNNRVQATIAGLTLNHDAYDITLAAMEGVAFQAAMLLEEYRRAGVNTGSLRVMGGGGSLPWMTILAAACRCRVERVAVAEASPLGAAMVAGVQCGRMESYEAAAAMATHCERLPEPEQAIRDFYGEKLQRYKSRWQSMLGLYPEDGGAVQSTGGPAHNEVNG